MSAKSTEPRLSIVVPCFNEQENMIDLPRHLQEMAESLVGESWEVVFINDGSRDDTLKLIREMHQKDQRFKGLSQSRNFGHQPALSAGLAFARGDYLLIMDADLQDPPEVAKKMFRMIDTGNYDIVLGVRGRRDASFILKMFYKAFYMIIRLSSDHPWPLDAGDFSIFNRKVHRALLSLHERERMLRGLRSWVGFREGRVVYDRPIRAHGKTKYNFWRLLALAKGAFVSFTTLPLRLSILVGFAMSFFTALLSVLFLVNRLFPQFTLWGYSIGANAGIATLTILILTLFAVLFFCIGIIGEYLALIVREVKGRPTAIIDEVIGNIHSESSTSTVVNPNSHSSGDQK